MDILVIDVGGSHIKVLATGQTEERKVVSGPTMTAAAMVDAVKAMTGSSRIGHIAASLRGGADNAGV